MTPVKKARPLVISMGDPAGIGAEIILKAAAQLSRTAASSNIVVIGDLGVMSAARDRIGRAMPRPIEWSLGSPLPKDRTTLPVLAVSWLSTDARQPGRPTIEGADASY